MAWIPNIANRMSDAFSEFLEDVGRSIQANQISFLGYVSLKTEYNNSKSFILETLNFSITIVINLI